MFAWQEIDIIPCRTTVLSFVATSIRELSREQSTMLPRSDAREYHTVQVMLTRCGECWAPGALTVTLPLSRMLLTVTVVCSPEAMLPLAGLSW